MGDLGDLVCRARHPSSLRHLLMAWRGSAVSTEGWPESTAPRAHPSDSSMGASSRRVQQGLGPHGLMKKLPPGSSTPPPYIRSRAGSPLSKQKEELCVLHRQSRHRHIRSFPVFSVGLGLVSRRGRPSGRGV